MDASIDGTGAETRAGVEVWIAAGTPDRHRALLPDGAEIHELPAPDAPGRAGPAEFVVADFIRQGFLEVLPRLDGVRGAESFTGFAPRSTSRIRSLCPTVIRCGG